MTATDPPSAQTATKKVGNVESRKAAALDEEDPAEELGVDIEMRGGKEDAGAGAQASQPPSGAGNAVGSGENE